MQSEVTKQISPFSRILWAANLLIWLVAEIAVIHIEIERHLYRIGAINFYYRPLMVTLPLAVSFNVLRKLENVANLQEPNAREQLSRGIASIALVFYLVLISTLIELT
jgi:ABC-type amino acid transport system permease subunit